MPTTTCPSCNTIIEGTHRFCPECGARLPDTVETDSQTVAAPSPTIQLEPPTPTEPEPPTPDATARLEDDPRTIQAAAPSPTIQLEPPTPTEPEPTAPAITSRLEDDAHTLQTPAIAPPPPAEPNQLPPPGASTADTPKRSQTPVWLLIGGIGCLGLVLLSACGLILVLMVAPALPWGEDSPVAQTSAPDTGGGGGILPGEGAFAGGDVLLRDTFDDPFSSSLGEADDLSSRYAFEDGAYVIEVRDPETLVWSLFNGTYGDVSISVDSDTDRLGPIAAAGLIFHYQDEDNFYLFSVSNDGYYALELLENDEWVVLIEWTESDAITSGQNQIRLDLQGDRIGLYANGTLLEETRDPTFTSGEVGLAVSSFEQPAALIRFDNMTIRRSR
jgi:hypothetical protein